MSHDLVPTSESDTRPDFDPDTFWKQFRHGTANVSGVRLHYVEGGQGAPILLLPGWPQSWYVWRHVMPLLAAAGRRVIAVDPRGMGDSDRPLNGPNTGSSNGYDLKTVAAELHGFIEALGLAGQGGIDVAGHDIGTWLGYALAADWPADVKRLAVFDAALPGISAPPPAGFPSEQVNVKTWHFGFNRLDDLPELLLQGRERAFLTWLFRAKAIRPWTISPADLDEYVRVNEAPGATRAALSYYRQGFSAEGLEQNQARSGRKLSMPVLAYGADGGVGGGLLATMQLAAEHVEGGVFGNCGHYIPEEAPRAVAARLLQFFSTD